MDIIIVAVSKLAHDAHHQAENEQKSNRKLKPRALDNGSTSHDSSKSTLDNSKVQTTKRPKALTLPSEPSQSILSSKLTSTRSLSPKDSV